MNKKTVPSGKKTVPADSRKSSREQQRIKKPTAPPPGAANMPNAQREPRGQGAPNAQRAANDPRTARQNAGNIQQRKKRVFSKSTKKAKPTKAQKPAAGVPKAKQPVSPEKRPVQNAAPRPSGSLRTAADPNAAKTPKTPKVSGKPRAAARTRTSPAKRHKYHGGNYILYYILAGMVVITVLAILANTVLFKCKKIVVSGNVRYTAEQVAEVSGIDLGNNLLHINTRRAEESIVSALAYVDSAVVKKAFPTGINIEVTEGEKWYCVREGSDTVAISHSGKILEQCEPNGLTVITGYEPESTDVGQWLKSKTDGKTDIPGVILGAIEKASLENVDEVDLDDRFSIKMSIDSGRVIIELGTVSDMESKLTVANKLIRERISETERVTILLSNPIQATVHRNHDPEPELPGTSDPDNPEDPGDTSNADNSDDSSKPQT